jgi:hypothetical protein
MAEEYNNNNQGAMYAPDEMEVIRQGKINIDGNDCYMMIVKSKDRNGNTHYNLYEQKAKIYETEKKKETDSDMDGSIKTANGDFKFWLRKKVSKSGLDYTDVSLAPKTTQSNGAMTDKKEPPKLDDEIPF